MDPISQNMPQFGEIFEQGKQVSTAATIAVKNAVSDAASSASNQLGIQNEHGGNNPTSQNNQGQLPQGDFLGAVTSESTKELVKDFYAPSDSLAQTSTQTGSSDDLEAQQHLAKLRKE
jgi:butyrate kinase